MNTISFLKDLTALPLSQLALISLGLNLLLCLASIVFYLVVHKIASNQKLLAPYQIWRGSDVFQVGITVLCNAFVLVLGVYLWKYQIVQINFNASWGTVLWQVIVLVLVMDFLMYVFHRLAHMPIIYSFIHRKHHDHTHVNALSLFVLSPFEAIGFGLFLIVVLGCFSFSYQAIMLYLLINLLWGTIGHFNIELFPAFAKSMVGQWIGTARFHNTHHQMPQANYGFYTTLWDKIAGTFSSTPKGGE